MNTEDALIVRLRERALDPARRVSFVAESVTRLRPAVTRETLAHAEALIGRPFPPLVQRLYGEVANGGFGPGLGLLPLAVSESDEQTSAPAEESSVVGTYTEFRRHSWPAELLPVCDWGCAAWSCVDTSAAEATIVTHDDVAGATVTTFSLASWLEAWLNGVDLWKEMYDEHDATIINPFTRKPVTTRVRGAAKGRPLR
jgi:hypothetical protein